MSLSGFGNVSTRDWATLRTGPGGDDIPNGDYAVAATAELRHVAPQPGRWDGKGFYATKFVTTEGNVEEYRNKVLEYTFWYHPNPMTEQHHKGNGYTLGDMARIVGALGFEDTLTNPEGDVDPVATLEAALKYAAEANVKLLVTVTHNDKGYMQLRNFRPTV